MRAAARLARILGPACVAATTGAAGAEPLPNVVLLSIDTLRSDRLGGYGCEQPTTPALDALARRGTQFERVITESSWTLPSHLSLLTGLHPTSHGVTQESQQLPEGVPTLAQSLKEHGWATAGFTEGGLVDGEYGFARGFDVYEDSPKEFRLTLYRARRHLEKRDPDVPFFLFLHTYAVHCPYDPRDEYAARFRSRPAGDWLETEGKCGNPDFNRLPLSPGQVRFLRDQYDGSIRAADDQWRGFVRFLEEEDLLESTIFVIVSDHGEEFLEHGRIGHEQTLYIESLLVPLILVVPGMKPAVVPEPVGLTDVAPTVLDLLGIEGPPAQGRSLVGMMQGGAGGSPSRFSELDREVRLRSVVRGDRHLILNLDRGGRSLFDLRVDPHERKPLGSAPDRDELEAAIRNHLDALPEPSTVPTRDLSPEQIERLKALGYVR